MNIQLALRTISEILQFDAKYPDDAAEEFAWLRRMSALKFDHYQGYEPGIRFLESLIGWLNQFKDVVDRRRAYEFVRNHLVFISREEIAHLVEMFYPMDVQPELVKQVAAELSIQPYEVWGSVTARARYRIRLRKSLFLGLSDGARIDALRRANEGRISNEQVVVGPDLSDPKWCDLRKELRKDLDKLGAKGEAAVFNNVFLIDDFTASGTTLLSKEMERKTGEWTGAWKGKVWKFIARNKHQLGKTLHEPCNVFAHHYIASKRGRDAATCNLAEFGNTISEFALKCSFGYVPDEEITVRAEQNGEEFIDLLKRHYNPQIENDHLGENIQLGYKQCALSIVLEHNCPNNSIAILWAETSESKGAPAMLPLFKRRERHK